MTTHHNQGWAVLQYATTFTTSTSSRPTTADGPHLPREIQTRPIANKSPRLTTDLQYAFPLSPRGSFDTMSHYSTRL
eukprot:8001686-Pyramimonas_sp.AAC.1